MEGRQKDVLYYEKLRTIFLGVILMVLAALLIGALVLVGSLRQYEARINTIVGRLETVSVQLEELDVEKAVRTANDVTEALDAEKISEIVDTLNDVAKDLGSVDWAKLAGNVNDVAGDAQTKLADAEMALQKINELDITSLNQAIQDLQDVIEPLAKFTKRFG